MFVINILVFIYMPVYIVNNRKNNGLFFILIIKILVISLFIEGLLCRQYDQTVFRQIECDFRA